ncbi:MAG: hypothetical protein HY757_05310, partial [Nitrospirae bacterium]|nr:hypothetical protein [Nitrospirota bacterium]
MNLFALSGAFLFSTGIILLVIIFISSRSRLHYIWGFFNVAVTIWGTSVFFIGRSEDYLYSQLWWKIAHVGIILIPVFFYHVIHLLCRLPGKKIIFFVYAQGVLFLVLNMTGIKDLFTSQLILVFQSFYYFTPGKLYHLFFACWLAIVFYGIAMLFITYRKSSGIRRNQLALFLIGLIVGFSGGITNFFPAYGLNLYPLGNYGIPLYWIIATYAILRYRLMDVNLIFKKSMVYSLSAGILTSLFVVLVLTMTKFVSNVTGITSFTITTIAALIIAVLFNPLKNRIQSLIDKHFYKRTYDYYPTIRDISRKLTSMFDLDELFNYIGGVIFSTLGLSNIYLLHTIPGRGYEIVCHKSHKKDKDKKTEGKPESDSEGKIRKNSELINYFKKSDEVLIKDELPGFQRALGLEIIERIKSDLKPFSGEAMVPVFIDKKLMLLLILGEKLSGDMFTNEDINLLNIISNQIAIARKNAELYKDKVRSERLASMGMMSATFAHEIRNPLTSLKTFA